MTVAMTSVVHRDNGHISAEIDNELVVLNVERGKYVGFDDIAQVIWARLQDPVTVEALCRDLCARFDGPPATIQADVLALLDRLLSEGMIVVKD